jgi:hypothetical protein
LERMRNQTRRRAENALEDAQSSHGRLGITFPQEGPPNTARIQVKSKRRKSKRRKSKRRKSKN